MGMISGKWKSAKSVTTQQSEEENRLVKLYTSDTADALYIHPMEALSLKHDGVVTLQYAIKRAIENIFQIESSEIGVELMGTEKVPNIFLYEAAEGSLGILSQFIENADIFHQIIGKAIKICRYDDKKYCEDASYDDLLSYYNQRHHNIINRFLIEDALQKLQICSIELKGSRADRDYDEHYHTLL